MAKHPKRPRDPNQRAKLVVDLATGSTTEAASSHSSQGIAAARAGGLQGGKARAAKLTPERRAEIAKKASLARWNAKK
jgi:hypothetical protein